jgi:ribosomal protein L19
MWMRFLGLLLLLSFIACDVVGNAIKEKDYTAAKNLLLHNSERFSDVEISNLITMLITGNKKIEIYECINKLYNTKHYSKLIKKLAESNFQIDDIEQLITLVKQNDSSLKNEVFQILKNNKNVLIRVFKSRFIGENPNFENAQNYIDKMQTFFTLTQCIGDEEPFTTINKYFQTMQENSHVYENLKKNFSNLSPKEAFLKAKLDREEAQLSLSMVLKKTLLSDAKFKGTVISLENQGIADFPVIVLKISSEEPIKRTFQCIVTSEQFKKLRIGDRITGYLSRVSVPGEDSALFADPRSNKEIHQEAVSQSMANLNKVEAESRRVEAEYLKIKDLDPEDRGAKAYRELQEFIKTL